jgi:hypothetical protein
VKILVGYVERVGCGTESIKFLERFRYSSPLLAASVTHALLIILRNSDVTFFQDLSLSRFDHGWSVSSVCYLRSCILGS